MEVVDSPHGKALRMAGKLILTLDDPEGHNPDVVRALVAAGADIQFVGELRYSLEDVYLQLVKDDATPAA